MSKHIGEGESARDISGESGWTVEVNLLSYSETEWNTAVIAHTSCQTCKGVCRAWDRFSVCSNTEPTGYSLCLSLFFPQNIICVLARNMFCAQIVLLLIHNKGTNVTPYNVTCDPCIKILTTQQTAWTLTGHHPFLTLEASVVLLSNILWMAVMCRLVFNPM